MKNLLKIMILVCIYIFAFSTCSFAAFNDVTGHWCENEINDFEATGFVDGYLDQTFRPDNEITRAEFCKIINSYMGYDVSGDWQLANLEMAKEKGYLTEGAAESTISREEAFVVLSRVMKLDMELQENVDLIYDDETDISIWALPAIKQLTVLEYIQGHENNLLKPKDNMTRAELVKVLYQYTGIGGLDEEPEVVEFKVGYMKHNQYGLEFVEIEENLEIEVDDTILLATILEENDGDSVFSIISGAELVEFENENLILSAKSIGKVELLIKTTQSKKEKKIEIIIK